jgi:hypothetical protein
MFSSVKEVWDNDPVKEMTNRLEKGDYKNSYQPPIKINEDKSLELDSSMRLTTETQDLDDTITDIINSPHKSYDCAYSFKHVKDCRNCKKYINTLIKKQIKKNVDGIVMDVNMNKIRRGEDIDTDVSIKKQMEKGIYTDNSKIEYMLLFLCIGIGMFIIYLLKKNI